MQQVPSFTLKTHEKGGFHVSSAKKCIKSQLARGFQVHITIYMELSSILDQSQLSSSICLEMTTKRKMVDKKFEEKKLLTDKNKISIFFSWKPNDLDHDVNFFFKKNLIKLSVREKKLNVIL